MRYVVIVALAALVGLSSADPAAAQERRRSDDDARVIIRDSDDDRGANSRGRTGDSRGRTDDDDRRRGRTGDVERGRTSDAERSRTGDVQRSRSGDDVNKTGRRADDRNERRRGDDDWDDDDWDDDDWDDDDYRDRRNRRNGNGRGPAFCRSGEGHPVFGREWCRDKGFGVGGRYDDVIWERRSTRDVLFPSRRNRTDRYMSGSLLERILGDVTYGRLGSHARDLRTSGPIRGRWNGDSELRIYAGGDPFARFVDLNGDNRADVIYLRK